MRYLLMLGFFCNVYKKKPNVRLKFNNQLIDEFDVEHCPDIHGHDAEWCEKLKDLHPLQPLDNNFIIKYKYKNLPPLRIYEVEIDKNQQKLKIHIEIKNSDSNYTNGFVTRSTLLQLRYLGLIPLNKKMVAKFILILKKKRIGKNMSWYYSNSLPRWFDLAENYIWYGQKTGILKNRKGISLYTHELGDDGYFEINLKKKYGLLIPENKKNCNYRYRLPESYINLILNKYQQYAN
jgi:hypothetical protein